MMKVGQTAHIQSPNNNFKIGLNILLLLKLKENCFPKVVSFAAQHEISVIKTTNC